MVTINHFRLIKESTTQPPHLNEYKVICGVQVYHSSFNILLYVLFYNNLYYVFEYTGDITDLDTNLKNVIRFHFGLDCQ